MRILVLSNRHNLLPFAHRLRGEGNEVDVIIRNSGSSDRYERAWEGSFSPLLNRSEVNAESLGALAELAKKGECVVLTDHYNSAKRFSDARHLFPALRTDEAPTSTLRLGGWFTGETLIAPHALVVDVGAWPYGMGPAVEGSLTLIRLDTPGALEVYDSLMSPLKDLWKSLGFRGLVQVGLDLDTVGRGAQSELRGGNLGWPFLHTHAFVAELGSLSRMLLGLRDQGVRGLRDPEPSDIDEPWTPKKFTTVIPVTIPPYPHRTSEGAKEVSVEGLTEQWQGRVFWHDVKVDQQERRLRTAGLDGLVGVTTGSADTPSLARAKALELAQAIELPEKQYRVDAAQGVEGALGGLETLGILL